MRLWHQSLIDYLPRQQLLGQHRECCAMRGNGWNTNHSTVNYVWNYHPYCLFKYHEEVMDEMEYGREWDISQEWRSPKYRGKNCDDFQRHEHKYFDDLPCALHDRQMADIIYPEHDHDYLVECIENLESKGNDMTEAKTELL